MSPRSIVSEIPSRPDRSAQLRSLYLQNLCNGGHLDPAQFYDCLTNSAFYALLSPSQIQDKLEDVAPPLKPVRLHNIPLLREVIDRCSLSRNPHARELARIFRYPHFRALVETHDEVGEVTVEQLKHAQSSPGGSSQSNGGFDDSTVVDSGGGGGGSSLVSSAVTTTATGSGGGMPGETIKMVGIRRNPNEPLGLTVEVDEHNQLVVARIIAGGMIDRQGLLHPGDVILEVNGSTVTTPEELQTEISRAKESVTLKIGPSIEEEMKSARIMMAGGQVKSGKNLEAGKKLTVSWSVFITSLCVCVLVLVSACGC